ncbi:HAD family hydrolase [Natronomonas sp. F2-12]|jgi:putative hydrolase of the HAD superfamily|uniref:HAD family hydrolase n=1 Tax=Natronomonas aquatica TaxID=2841590 RepID=A0A9R1CSG9_9EURY|nr:HAD family hydrolase [Natronomonas aquatica]MCQ4332982.1 HAD family hydrolase [Natronomonas aquatica]
MTPDAVLFDLDDTLCRYRRSGASLLAAAFDRTGIEPFVAAEEYYGRYPEFVEESESMVDLRERCFAAIAAEKGHPPGAGRRVARAYADERDHGNVERLPGVEAALGACSDVPVGIVTNGAPEMQAKKLETIGLDDAFDVVVHAGYDTAAKPSSDPFEAALAALSADPARSYHVGNSLRSDVAGANAAGVRSVWLAGDDADAEPSRRSDPDHVVSGLGMLPDVLSTRNRP